MLYLYLIHHNSHLLIRHPIYLIILIWIIFRSETNAQNAQEIFGKNKVQYNDDQQEWWIYESSNIVYYWYGKSRKAAEFYISIAEAENKKIREIFEFHLRDKIELVIYSDLSDLHQTNLDLDFYFTPENWKEEPRVIDQKILLYFDGNHQNALKLLRKGLMKIYFNSIFSGSQLEEAVQKVISLRLPDWFEKGLTTYLSDHWSEKDILEMKFLLKNKIKKRNSFRRFYNLNVALAGKSMWNFIVQTYGQQAISNWLYMTRIQKDVNQAAKLVFQRNLSSLYNDWMEYYSHELQLVSLPSENYPRLRLKKEEEIQDLQYSKVFKTTVLTTNQNSRKRVRLLNEDGRRSHVIYRSGHRNKINLPEKYYPLYAEKGRSYAILDQHSNRNYLKIYSDHHRLLDQSILPEDIQEVYDFELINDHAIIFTGTNNGYSDVFIYELKGRSYRKLTDDIYDDLSIVKEQSPESSEYNITRSLPVQPLFTVVPDSIVPLFPFSVFALNLNSDTLNRVCDCINHGSVLDYSESPRIKIFKCSHLAEDIFYSETSDGRIDQQQAFLSRIRLHSGQWMLKLLRKPDGKYLLIKNKIDSLPGDRRITELFSGPDTISSSKNEDSLQFILKHLQKFESRFGDPENTENLLKEFYRSATPFRISDLKATELKYEGSPLLKLNPSQAIAYRYRFSMDDWSTTFNNDLLFGGLRTYTGLNPAYPLPRPGILFKTKLQEVFENYTLEFGIRVPTSFIGSEAFLLFNINKFHWDHSIAIYRRADKQYIPYRQTDDLIQVSKTFLLNYVAKYPLDQYRSFRINNTLRNDHTFLRNSERFVLDSSGQNIQSLGTRLEFVYDDALQLGVNLKQGLQLKSFFEINKRFISSLNGGINISGLPGWLLIAGIDARYHHPVLKHSVFANRFYLNSSFGSQRLLNQLGGTENWLLFAKYNNEQPSDINQNYSFSQIATEVRGHPIGERKGSSAMLLNSELRIPFFQYLLNQNWRNSFFRNLQLVTFFDIGLTWNGFLPKLADVEKYRYFGSNPAVTVNVVYSRNPFIAGTGLGLRTSLFGYFVRLDYGWPIIDFKTSKPVMHISLGLDF